MRKLDALKKQMAKMQAKCYELEAEAFTKEIVPRLKKMIGDHFVYRHGGGRSETWPVYMKLVAVALTSHSWAWLIFEQAELCADGTARIGHYVHLQRTDVTFPGDRSGWEPCDPAEYASNLTDVNTQLSYPHQLIADLEKR
jgi:hypothetical protein